jgi:hypothetical protein
MSGFYHWDDERIVDWEMKEIQREIAQANLLREAGLSGTDWLARAVNGLLNLLSLRGRDLQDHRSTEGQSYQSPGKRAAE